MQIVIYTDCKIYKINLTIGWGIWKYLLVTTPMIKYIIKTNLKFDKKIK